MTTKTNNTTQSSIGESTVRMKRFPVRVSGYFKAFNTIDEAIAYAKANELPVRLTAHGYPILLANE